MHNTDTGTTRSNVELVFVESPYWSWIDIQLLQALINTSTSREAEEQLGRFN